MKRRTLDLTLATVGLVMAVVLAIASGLLLFAASFTHTTITDQLSAQKISFPPAAALSPELQQYADQAVTTGPLAKAYSDMISEHLAATGGGKTYSEISAEWIASAENPADRDPALGQVRQTMFMGETLRGLLLNVYAFSIFGTVALIAGWVAAVAALVMIGLALYGFSHAHTLHKQELVSAPAVESIPVS
jgi:hypothetical protein